jgi:LAS superfamily LD-carboxypeptidase LdcB
VGQRRTDNRIQAAIGAVVVLAAAVALALPAAAQSDAEAERDAVRDRQGRVAERIDVLSASDAQISRALDRIDAALAAQEAALQAALAESDAAAAAVRQAERDLRSARRDVAVLEAAIVEMAVASYVRPPTADLVQSLQAQSLSDSLIQRAYLDARAQRDLGLLDLLEIAERHAEERTAELAAASEAADRAVEAADSELVRLDEERQHQASFAADLQGRIDGALAEAAALADLDADLSAQIVAQQAALIERLPPPPAPPEAPVEVAEVTEVAVAASPAATQPTPAAPTPPAPTPAAPTPAPTTPAPTTTTTRPPAAPAPVPPSTSTPPLRTVRGFTVHAGIADDVEAMLVAAAADGITFGGSGYRSTERQIQLRIANCGPTHYDIWYRPASTCSPPTAVPGRSLHEQGRALDLTFEGRLITTRSNRGFQWLAANAASYGLFNLPSEPWHWSTTGA